MLDALSRPRSPDEAARARSDQASLEAMLARFDALIASPEPMSPVNAAELIAMAGIFDLDATQSPPALWSELRTVLTAQSPRVADEIASFSADEALTLLVVEDDPHTAQDLIALLVEGGHDVVGPFHSAEAAEVAAGLHAIDIALLDINLSGAVDGGTLGRRLRERWGMKVIFLSGDVTAAASHADIAEAMVIKPYRGADVLGAIQRATVPTRS